MSDVMQFGKHKGKGMADIPLDYLQWCVREIAKCPKSVVQEIDRRVGLTGDEGKAARKYLAAKEDPLTYRGTITGRDYGRLRAEFDRAGGDADQCPFDTADYAYTGPSIYWVGGQPVISPSEFPMEATR